MLLDIRTMNIYDLGVMIITVSEIYCNFKFLGVGDGGGDDPRGQIK